MGHNDSEKALMEAIKHSNKGYYYEVNEDPDNAEKSYKRAIDMCPDLPEPYRNLALLLYNDREDYDGAKKVCRRLIKVAPNYAWGHFKLASILEMVDKDFAAAKREYLLTAILRFDKNALKSNLQQ